MRWMMNENHMAEWCLVTVAEQKSCCKKENKILGAEMILMINFAIEDSPPVHRFLPALM